MPGFSAFALWSALLFGQRADLPQFTSFRSVDDLQVVPGSKLADLSGPMLPPGAKAATGIVVGASLALPSGRPLAVASGRSGEVWVLLDQPVPGLPGIDRKGLSPFLVLIRLTENGWRQTGLFAAPQGARTLAALGHDLLVGASGSLWRLSAQEPEKKPNLIVEGDKEVVPVPALDEQGNAFAMVAPGVWQCDGGKNRLVVPGKTWGIIGLGNGPNTRRELYAWGMAAPGKWLSPAGDGEIFAVDHWNGKALVRIVRGGNDLGFRGSDDPGASGRMVSAGLGAILPLAGISGLEATCGLALGNSLGKDWRGVLLVGATGRLTGLVAPRQGGVTRQINGKRELLVAPGNELRPVGLAEDAGGAGVWMLEPSRDFVAEGVLPLEPPGQGKLLLLQNPEWLASREALAGPLQNNLSARDALMQVPQGAGRVAKARELANLGGEWSAKLAELALDTSVQGELRLAAWNGLASSPLAEKKLANLLVTDNSQLRAAAARYCSSLSKLPVDLAEALLGCLQDGDGLVSSEAALATGAHQVPGAAELLAAGLFQRDETDPQVQSCFLYGLGLLGAPGAERMLAAAQTGVRAEAVRALRARIGFPWEADKAGRCELWLEHPHLGPDHQALYLEGQRAWLGWNGGKPVRDLETGIKATLNWLEDHADLPPEVLEAGLRLSGDLHVKYSPVDWWRLMVREQKGEACSLALQQLARLSVPAWGGEVATELEREDLSSAERLAGIRLMRAWKQGPVVLKLAVPVLEPGAIPGQDATTTQIALEALAEFDQDGGREAAQRVLRTAKVQTGPARAAARLLAKDIEVRQQVNTGFAGGKNSKFPSLDWSVWVDSLAEAGAGAESDQTLAETWLADNDARKNLALTVANLGDARRGLFVALDRKKANCVGCHLVQGAGGTVGPPLISKLPVDHLLESLVRPNAKLAGGHQTVRVRGIDGQEIRGVLLRTGAGSKELPAIQDANGRVHLLGKDQYSAPFPDPSSLMPTVGGIGLTHNELVDLLAFLSSTLAVEKTMSGLVLKAEIQSVSGTWLGVASGPEGLLEVPVNGPIALRFELEAQQAGDVEVRLLGAQFAEGQAKVLKLKKGTQILQMNLVLPNENNSKKQIALRLFGPQGLRLGQVAQ